MARLAGLSIPDIQAHRMEIAAEKAAAWKVVLILKGAHTVIAGSDGQVNVLPFKTDALAKAGTGDVLAGAVVGLLAQGSLPYNAALLAGFVHGLAGTLAAAQAHTSRSLLAGEVADMLGEAISQIETGSAVEA
jgi:NAD(P)H-hydrate epimerase